MKGDRGAEKCGKVRKHLRDTDNKLQVRELQRTQIKFQGISPRTVLCSFHIFNNMDTFKI